MVRLARGAGVPVVGRGTGTGLSGGAIAPPGGIQIAFPRMNHILEVDTDNRMAVVEPGVINLHLDPRGRKDGLRYAPDPSSQKACSLGGNIAENSGGPHCLAYGTTTNHVLGMEVVLEDGTIVNLGSLARETVGYDLRGVFTGSEGTFGIATKIAVRLLPVPEAVRTFLGIFPDVESACTAVSAVIEHGIVPAALEMIDALTIQAVQKVGDAGYPDDAGAVLLIELEGLHDEVDEISEEVEAALWDTGATQVRTAEEAKEREQLWVGRNGALGALGSIAPNYFLVDGVVPRTQLASVLGGVAEVSKKYDIPIANVFHAGDGNLHPILAYDSREPGVQERVHAAGRAIVTASIEAGGVLSGEHGIGLEKRDYMGLLFTEHDMRTQDLVREAFDPDGLANPLKVLPSGSRCSDSFGQHVPEGAWV